MRTRLLFIFVWCFLMFTPRDIRAHEDTRIELKEGVLVGLPKNYAPAEFDPSSFRIRIGNHAMTLSPLLRSLFDQPHDLDISASWYHERKILPPYILLRIRPKKKDFSYHVLLNLETLELIELSVVLQESESTTRQLAVALSEEQKEDIRKSITDLK